MLALAPEFNRAASSFSAGSFSLQVDQLSGHGAVVIFASTNLVDWIPVFTNAPHAGSLQFLDSSAPGNASRFYRALEC